MRRILQWLGIGVSRSHHTADLKTAIGGFETKASYRFGDRTLIACALTHRSYLNSNKNDLPSSNERLEFLGDAVLELVVNEHLYRRFPDHQEGELTKMKSLLVSRSILADQASALELGTYILLSDAERESGGESRASILADGFEAVIGAIYLDGGLSAAQAFIQKNLLWKISEILDNEDYRNYKSSLQEYVQEKFKTYPRYLTLGERGPDHDKVFEVEVVIKRERLGIGEGKTKKAAEQAAAKNALLKLGLLDSTEGDTVDPVSD
ncbi:MAG: ribonuclease III [Candidatus Eisenbacteria bacterium]|uniref:Ribonuclease 3 n=1 Tax=Eiseniibacteriota bacterium TaxID=2212470 RepID=A0A7Y2E6U4_UNCEI|nr:ribonuclease III [Candidatus Eisenbacteria bacterium]